MLSRFLRQRQKYFCSIDNAVRWEKSVRRISWPT